MSFISPLERLADKFNIISFNTREVISKLSAWSVSDEDSIQVMLKVEDSPYFETYKIPTLKYIKSNSIISNWKNNRPVGVKYWGTDMLKSTYLVNSKYVVNIDSSNYPLNHYLEYNGADIEDNLSINLQAGQFVGDVLSFVVKVSTLNIKKHVIYFNDVNTNKILLKVNKSHLVNVVDYSPSLIANKANIYKISFQYVNDPYSGNCWKLFDLYELPSAEYVEGSTSLKDSIFKDPFIQ